MDWRSWTILNEVKYQNNPVFINQITRDLAYEPLGEGRLVELPAAIMEAIRSGAKGDLC